MNCNRLMFLKVTAAASGRLEPVLDRWREKAANVSGRSLPAGHFLPEEIPEQTLSALLEFLA